MVGKQTNPTRPRYDRGARITARAPYNFVPLPDEMVEADPPLAHDHYDTDANTGWVECTLETHAPTYVRGMMALPEYVTIGRKSADELTEKEKLAVSAFFSHGEQEVEGHLVPAIPGSSLRGMVRSVMEIAGYGRMRWVADAPTFKFRAVAAQRSDPLRSPYEDMLGRYGRDVKAGYLHKRRGKWYIIPAYTPQQVGWPEKSAFLKVKEKTIGSGDIPGFTRLSSPKYQPGYYGVTFDAEVTSGKRGPYVAVTRIGSPEAGKTYQFAGTLVCSGNMKENNPSGRTSRKNHTLVLPKNKEIKRPYRIPNRVVDDYLKGMSPYERDNLWTSGAGCLKKGAPVFFVLDKHQKVLAFGHCPNFRVPALVPGTNRAATPLDFVPDHLRENSKPDLVDAVFGWVEEDGVGLEGQYAGRVSFGDAHFSQAIEGVWYSLDPITPHPLAGPKPTTFQHYLVQDADKGHNPDDKSSLAHYGTPASETEIRGYKRYWHKGSRPDIEASSSELRNPETGHEHESQLTRIVPVKPGVQFKFRVHFENLRDAELGALLWALMLPSDTDRIYRHKLGMGKPLGMGAVSITGDLHLTNRVDRYSSLFRDDGWDLGDEVVDPDTYVGAFEKFILRAIGRSDAQRLVRVERIRMLMAMLEWHESDQAWLERTRYMEISRGSGDRNEYKERPVLPDPLNVSGE